MIFASAGAMSPSTHASSTHRCSAMSIRSLKFSPFSVNNPQSTCKFRKALCRSTQTPNESPNEDNTSPTESVKDALRAAEQAQQDQDQQRSPRGATPKRQADSTDFIATQLTRRFGIAGGLAWLGFLTFGVVSEQVKTRIEVAEAEKGTKDVAALKEITTQEGIRYTDLRIGGGAPPQKGYLIILDYKAKANGEVFEDTKGRGKPIVFLFGSRPFTGGLCPGVELALSTMKAGGKRKVILPAALGFGDRGTTLRPTEHVPEKQGVVPPGAELEYELELIRVSIPPS